MSLRASGAKLAYLLHGALSMLVLGALTWATVVSLRLERADQITAAQRDYEGRLRSTMYQLENWINPMLFREFSRQYREYVPFYSPNADEVRLATGEVIDPTAIVQPSPLLLEPPKPAWILMHFTATATAGFRSPQLVPAEMRRWPGFEAAYDTWDREPIARLLASLEYSFTTEDLAMLYELAPSDRLDHTETPRHQIRPIPAALANAEQSITASGHYQLRKQTSKMIQQVQLPQMQCLPQPIAEANIHPAQRSQQAALVNEVTDDDSEVGITYHDVRPIWIRLPGRSRADLAFLRAVHVDYETLWQGFLIDWHALRAELMDNDVLQDLFPKATLEPIDTNQPRPADDAVFTIIPAKLVTNETPTVAAGFDWDSTHTFLAFGWAGALTLLGALGLGIRSLVTLSQRRSQFAYAVTHELRTPLTTFRLYTDMLANGMVSEESRQEYLATLNQESRRLADLVSGVLEYSRIENNSVLIAREKVKVADLLESIRDGYEHRCETAGMKLRIDANGAGGMILNTDPRLAVQIIGNLVDNACKYGRGAHDSFVHISAGTDDGQLVFDVADNGPGIPPKYRNEVFKPYFRAQADHATVTGGIGLGLALSRSWAKMLGGRLELLPCSRGQQGARFRFSLNPNAS